MSKKSLLILLVALNSWLPWTYEAKALLQQKKAIVIFTGQPGYARGMCCGVNPASFSVNSNCASEDLQMVVLHESQHLLGHLYAERNDFPGWSGFEILTLACAVRTQPLRMRELLKFAEMGPWELHAQAPWLLKGNLCPELQPWYPWFELSRVAPPQEDAARPVLKSHVKGISQHIAPS